MTVNLFDVNFYRQANPDLAAAGLTTNAQLFSHFENYGLNEGRAFSPYANLNFYRASNNDLAGFNKQQLFNHLEQYGIQEDRKFSEFINLDFYRAANPDLAKMTSEHAFEHLQNYGLNEGRQFSPFVDINFYKSANSDLASLNNIQALENLEMYGMNDGQKFSPFVDLKVYQQTYSDLESMSSDQALQHLEIHGLNEGREFSPIVDLNYYRSLNSDLASFNNSQALQHLEINGINEGRKFSPVFNINYYKPNNADLVAAKLNNLQLLEHYELYGYNERRSAYLGEYHQGNLLSSFSPTSNLDLVNYGGHTIPHLNFFNIYLGGNQSWSNSDIHNIDSSLAQAMSDQRLNNIMSQYFSGQQITSNFLGSEILSNSTPSTTSQQYLENLLSNLGSQGKLNSFDLNSTVLDFMLPRYTVLTDNSTDSSTKGLGGYHGSVEFTINGVQKTAYYAVDVYSQAYSQYSSNGVVAFNQPWKNVVATAYHELNEARTDADVEQGSSFTGNNGYLGWYSQSGDEIGDTPINLAELSGNFSQVFQEIPLANGQGTVPIQLLYSNRVHGVEDPTTVV